MQQHVEYVRMRFFDFVEEHNGVRSAPNGFGKLAALFVTDVARRRTDQARDRVFLHVFAHVDADHGVFVVEQKLCKRSCQFRFADAGWSEKNE